jgi:hypothetical protein
MKIAIESTNQLTHINGQLTRVWRGVTENGVKCFVFVATVGVDQGENSAQFERELVQTVPPAEDRIISLRAIT